ncbi:MAG: hypothetical protein ACLQEQ_05670 [Nitrososphaerales archaeon]
MSLADQPMSPEEKREFAKDVLRELFQEVTASKPQPVGSIDSRPIYERTERKPEEYKGDPPTGANGKPANLFSIDRRCQIKGCNIPLQVRRVPNVVWQEDDQRTGGQLIYQWSDVKYFVVCSKHSGVPPLYWDERGRYLEKPHRTIAPRIAEG